MDIRFDGRVAIVTGAGTGLGRQHALLLASRGAKVVVNDPGGSVDGTGGAATVADKVVAEIKAAGGEAVASYASVAEAASAQSIIDTAINTWGRLDALVCNAGILRDKAFNNMTLEDYEFVNQVHHFGTVYCVKAAWPIMRKQTFGRIVVTTSGSGTVGNFGQANYGAAKMAVNGLINVLRFEGAKYNIRLNAISPSAYTRMTESLLPPDMAPWMKPELVSPMVAWLCHEDCDQTGEIFAATAAGYARVQYFVSEGVQFDPAKPVSIEMIRDNLDRIRDLSQAKPYFGMMGNVVEKLREMGRVK
ncbi:MAG TPA: SDR family NAD(P)-dependent oxidoreductase [Rhodopila sp.]|uniref:SDR family NAD(P)-dependent oxidoreductase n=1 Tax=Rhodopila sp. TaxID=2480087 RepID=UPI002BC86D8A|nr:SDR family NAD(P)-dependent oxidoreductase [Rhodopila sp.]HVY16458.1 SDR family NAD(P)-dependent oxidoreductase [Rhodopila sp.]